MDTSKTKRKHLQNIIKVYFALRVTAVLTACTQDFLKLDFE